MKAIYAVLLFSFLFLCVACGDDAPQVTTEPPTNEALKNATSIEGLGGETNSMAVGSLNVTFSNEVLAGATKVALFINGNEVASNSAAPFSLTGFDTRSLQDGPYTLRIVATYADGSQREVSYDIVVSNVLLRLRNQLFDLRSDYAVDFGQRVAVTDKEGNVLDWQDVRNGGDFVFYAPEGFYDPTIAFYAISGDELDDIGWLSYSGIPRGMSWSNSLDEEQGRYSDYRQQELTNFRVNCTSNCPTTGKVVFSGSGGGFIRLKSSDTRWPYDFSRYINKIDPFLLGGIVLGNEARWGYVNLAETGEREFDLSAFQTYAAQKQDLTGDVLRADVQIRLAPNQRSGNLFPGESFGSTHIEDYQTYFYTYPSLNDVNAYMVDLEWGLKESSGTNRLALIGVSVFDEVISDPRPVSHIEVINSSYRNTEFRMVNETLTTFKFITWYEDGQGDYIREYVQLEFGDLHFAPIHLEQVFSGTSAQQFENVMLGSFGTYYLPGMTQQQFLEVQNEGLYPLVVDPFFHNLQEVRWYGEALFFYEEGERRKASEKRKFSLAPQKARGSSKKGF